MTHNKFKSSIGSRFLKGLFYETTGAEKSSVLYTLKDEDHLNFPSLYRHYMEMEDLTEWEFANTYLDGWEHWQMLCECSWFQPYVTRWRKELELKIRAATLRSIRETAANSDHKLSFAANKWLTEGGWKEKEGTTTSKRGRPKKDTKEQDDILAAEAKLRIKEDFERLKLN